MEPFLHVMLGLGGGFRQNKGRRSRDTVPLGEILKYFYPTFSHGSFSRGSLTHMTASNMTASHVAASHMTASHVTHTRTVPV